MAVTHTGGESPHATLGLVLYQAQEVEGLRACTTDIARDMADESYLGRGISLSLTETGLVARPDAFGLSGQVWVQAKLTDHWMTASSGDPYVNVALDCFYGLAHTNRVSNSIPTTTPVALKDRGWVVPLTPVSRTAKRTSVRGPVGVSFGKLHPL